MTNFLPAFFPNLYPLGNFLIPVYCLIIIYAVLKTESFEIGHLYRGITYSLLLFVFSSIYWIAILTMERKFQTLLNYRSFYASATIAFILGLFFVPLRHKVQNILDKMLFKGTYEDISNQNRKLMDQVAETEKYRTLATLASGIAHEIRNPLTVIKTFTEYLPDRKNDSEFINKYAQLTSSEVSRIEDLVNQLMNYSKPNPPKRKSTKIKPLISDTLDVLSNQLLSRNISCRCNLRIDETLVLNIDRNQIHQAIFNVALNSIDAMPNGGQLYVVAEVKFLQKIEKLVIKIKDTGPGISQDHLQQIFDPFFTQKDFGTGLGLAIVQGIIENHNGKITARSKPGKGTEIEMELPLDL